MRALDIGSLLGVLPALLCRTDELPGAVWNGISESQEAVASAEDSPGSAGIWPPSLWRALTQLTVGKRLRFDSHPSTRPGIPRRTNPPEFSMIGDHGRNSDGGQIRSAALLRWLAPPGLLLWGGAGRLGTWPDRRQEPAPETRRAPSAFSRRSTS